MAAEKYQLISRAWRRVVRRGIICYLLWETHLGLSLVFGRSDMENNSP